MASVISTPTPGPMAYPYQTSADSSPLFSMQDALWSYSGFMNPYDPAGRLTGTLFRSGCVVDGIVNCTAACQDVNQIFADPHTFQNCMTMVAIQDLLTGNFSVTLDGSPTALAEDFSIYVNEPSFQSLASGVNTTILDCLHQYLEQSPGYDTDTFNIWNMQYIKPFYVSGHFSGLVQASASGFPSICEYLLAPLNADVGGIGVQKATFIYENNAYPWQVYISYWLQGGISLSAFLALKLCDKVPYQTRLRRFLPALKSATVEFHKAQCFFMLAIDIATQVVLKTGTLNDGSANLQGLYNNYVLIGSISLSGLLPVSFMLLTLHSVGVRSWYLLTLSSCTVALSAATLYTTGRFNPNPADLMRLKNQVSGSFPACGKRDPSDYCLQTAYVTSTFMDIGRGSIGGPILMFTIIILALIFSDYCGVQDTAMYRWVIEWYLQGLKLVSKAVQYPRDPQGHSYSSLRLDNALRYTSHCLYFITWTCDLMFWAYYLKSLKVGASAGIVQTWTFGQIVAISVWAQPLFEYVKLSVQGLKRGLQYRISQPYTIIKTPDKSKPAGAHNCV